MVDVAVVEVAIFDENSRLIRRLSPISKVWGRKSLAIPDELNDHMPLRWRPGAPRVVARILLETAPAACAHLNRLVRLRPSRHGLGSGTMSLPKACSEVPWRSLR